MKTKFLSMLTVFFLLCTSFVCAAEEEMITITEKPIAVTYNGDAVMFPDATPIIANGRTLVPVRAIMERAHLDVTFDEATRTVTATKDSFSITMTLDNPSAEIIRNDERETVNMDEPACLIQGRTFVPVRFLAESLGVKVNWNPYAREVVLIDTAEWKQEIASRSLYLNLLFDKPFVPAAPEAGNSATNITLHYVSENVPDIDGTPKNWAADLSLSSTETNVFDGKKGGSFASVQAKLSQLMNIDPDFLNIMFKNPHLWTLSKLSKSHHLEIDSVYGTNRTKYIRSAGLADIFRDLEQPALADQIAKQYVAFQPDELLSLFYTNIDFSNDADVLSTAKSEWELFETIILRDDMLYSRSVQSIDALLTAYMDLFDNSCFKTSRHWDGTYIRQYNPAPTELKENLLRISVLKNALSGSPLDDVTYENQKKILQNTDVSLKISLVSEMPEGTPFKSESSFSVKMKKQAIPDIEGATREFTLEIQTGESTRDFESKRDRRVVIPKNTVPFAELYKE
ncbi:MAG: copper amine oxidase N-terminal domain-containing protein [Clostridia bacterium]|nr:copper amine oxidase N-terminal domain-containing protein [Clostridia bacterium]